MIVRFEPRTQLRDDLEQRVDAYLASQDEARIRARMLLKTGVILLWVALSYAALVWWAPGPLWALLVATCLGLGLAGVGFAHQHDANHGAYPVGKRLRRALGFLLDVMGGSSYVWVFQHNINHHTFTNVWDADNDINVGGVARFSPSQRRMPHHRWQHVYAWPLYSLLAVNWMLWADWRDFFASAIGSNRFPGPKGAERWLFWIGKVVWVAISFVVPALYHPWWVVLLVWLWTYLVLGWTLSVVFQLAHVVEEAEFPAVPADEPRAGREFVAHQLATTVNFAPTNRLLNWYLGGLNFQVEHHLFPRVCHLHYPALAKIVEQTCREHGAPYHSLPTLRSALASHTRWLRRMGAPQPERLEQTADLGAPAVDRV